VYIGQLKHFQEEGVQFFLEKKKAICAFDMGLGKTHVSMAAVEKIGDSRTLVICPNYLKYKWEAEIQRWTDSFSLVIEGTPKQRAKLYYNEALFADYVLINYELLLKDYRILKTLNFDIIIADEITRIKNFSSKTSKILKRFEAEYKWGLTGTPVGNKPDELFSIMEWIDRGLLGNWFTFDRAFVCRGYFREIVGYRNLQKLSKRTELRMISKLQEEVADELPEVQIQNILVNPTKQQAIAYDIIASSLEGNLDMMVRKLLEGVPKTLEEKKIRQRFSALRQVCVMPALLTLGNSKYAKGISLQAQLDDGAKVKALMDLIDDTTDKMVVFCFYRGMINYLETQLTIKGIGFTKILGGMGAQYVNEQIVDFNTNPEKRILITSDAIEKGVDLQSARYLVNLDIPFSWEKYSQRIGRVKRIGSPHKLVNIYNIIIRGSFEERQAAILESKKDLALTIQGKTDSDTLQLPVESLRLFLQGHHPPDPQESL
jgi:SNF2 family DNA or RNA helicase